MGKSSILKINETLPKQGLALKQIKLSNVEAYIAQFDPEIQERLKQLQKIFFELVPDTEESIRYNMPAYKVGKHHLYFAAYKNHIGFYPVYGLPQISEEIAAYRAKKTKDSLHFPHSKLLPLDLIKKIIQLRAK